jgi:uncharacterized protein (TIGR02284 family)
MAAEERDMNRDPITDEPGAHPVGVGAGATGGAVAGAAVGAIGGPIGAAVGGAGGAGVGGLAGKAAAEAVNPTAEEAFWKENYAREPYYESGRSFDDYGPAYRLGLSGRSRYDDPWTSVEPKLASEWETTRGSSSLGWDRASHASRAAWQRADQQYRGAGSSASGMGAAGMVGAAQSAGDDSGSNADVLDVLKDLAECSKDGEYGFRECAEQAKRQDLKTTFLQRADDCRSAAQELNQLVRQHGGSVDEGGSAMGAMHRGWVSIKSKLTTYDDKAVLEECERGEDNAKARYTKALKQPLPAGVKLIVERQMQGLQRNHDQVKMLRDQLRAGS